MPSRQSKQISPEREGCAFCGNGPLTEEHFWGQWAHGILPDSPTHVQVMRTREVGQKEFKVERFRRNQGSTKNIRPKVVCATCNTGWMRELEEQAAPVLTALSVSQDHLVGPEQWHGLAQFSFMKIVVAGHFYPPEQRVFSLTQRQLFRETMTIPSGFTAMVFRCGEGGWPGVHYRHALEFLRPGELPTEGPCNTEVATFGFGDLLVFAVWSSRFTFPYEVREEHGARLWPEPTAYQWPPKERMGISEAWSLATLFERLGTPL